MKFVGFLILVGITRISAVCENIQLTGNIAILTNVNKSALEYPPNPYRFTTWTDASEAEAHFKVTVYGWDSSNKATAAFKAEWDESKDFLARVGVFLDNDNQTYKQYDKIKAEYSYTRDAWRNCSSVENGVCIGGVAGDYSYIGVYGWARNPLVEYYIVDDWFGNRWQSDETLLGDGTICYDGSFINDTTNETVADNTVCRIGEITVDGAQYKVYKHHRNAYSIDGFGEFDQYYSVRATPRKCGTISITEHFEKWEGLGLEMGPLYEAALLVEAGGGKGWIDYSKASVCIGSCNDIAKPGSNNNESFGHAVYWCSWAFCLLILAFFL